MCQSMLQGVVGGERKKQGEGAGKEVEGDGQEEEHSVGGRGGQGQEAGDEDGSSVQSCLSRGKSAGQSSTWLPLVN